MELSERGLNLIKKWEGLRFNAYKVTSADKYYTIGYGHYGADVQSGQTITEAEATAYLRADVRKAQLAVEKYDRKYKWTQNEYDALVSFAFNIGNIDQLTAYGQRDKNTIGKKMLEYVKSGGTVLTGLVNRRKEESALFFKPDFQNVSCETFKCPCCGAVLTVIQ